MTTIQFYHLITTPLERALPKLLEKAVAGGYKVLLVTSSDEQVEHLNQMLWTYDPGSFLPHGSVKNGNVEKQPILITTLDSLPPRLRGGWGGELPHYGKIGEAEYTSRKPEALTHAKELRTNVTEAEKKLWHFLQQSNLGYSFRRQHPVGDYITDFACIEKKIIIEIDGGQHGEQQAYDTKRTAFLEEAGFKVLRFWNNEVLENHEGVLQVVQEALKVEGHPPSPPASGGVKREILLTVNGAVPDKPEAFERILDMFDGNDPQAVANARNRWKNYKESGHALTYLRQTDSGGWEKKDER